jgi:hypothetical protein
VKKLLQHFASSFLLETCVDIEIRAGQGRAKHAPPGLLRVRNAENYTVVVLGEYRMLFVRFLGTFLRVFR